jgi:hypothetical protein
MISEEANGLANKIIKSKAFGNSSTYAILLRYLVRCTLDNDIPKETTIAREIFGKQDFDPSQSTLIRVYVYNLRKKLHKYYLSEGAAEPLCLKIPKGGYAVELIDNKKNTFKYLTKRKILLPFSVLLLLSLLTNIYFAAGSQNKELAITQTGLWKNLLNSERPKMLVMGDLFIYNETDRIKNTTRTVRYSSINSLETFSQFKQDNQDEKLVLEAPTYTYLILSSSQWIKNLSEIFYSLDEHYAIRTISRFNPKQLQDHDILVVGMHKTLGLFKDFYVNSSFKYDTLKDEFIFNQGEESIVYRPSGDPDSYHTDYGLMAKVPGPSNNNIFIFSGIWDTGATQSLKNFTDTHLCLEIEKKMKSEFGTIPEYYEVFFEVNGIDRMELSSKVLYLKSL